MITSGQVGVRTTPAITLVRIPPGPCTVALSNNGTQSVYVGMGTVTTANGFPLPSGAVPPFVFPGYQGSPGGVMTAIVPAGTAVVGWLVSYPAGGTGF